MSLGERAHAALLQSARAVRGVNLWLARVMAWCAVLLVAAVLVVVVLRYGFDIGLIALQEAAQYLHAAIFLLAAAGVLVLDGHVRVDVLRNRFPESARRRIEMAGHLLLLLPFALFVLWASLPYVAESWRLREASIESSGLPFVYLLKTLMPIAAVQLGLQALAGTALLAAGEETTAPGESGDLL